VKRGNKRGLLFQKFLCQGPLSLALEEKGERERKGNQDRGKEGEVNFFIIQFAKKRHKQNYLEAKVTI
jgi:hypothetical protein